MLHQKWVIKLGTKYRKTVDYAIKIEQNLPVLLWQHARIELALLYFSMDFTISHCFWRPKMKAKMMILALSSLCVASFTTILHAEDRYSADVGYAQNFPHPTREPNNLSISVNLDRHPRFVVTEGNAPHHRYKNPKWINLMPGYPVPPDAVIGGDEPGRAAPFYVCHANYRTGVHPGKLLDGKCNITWGGNEVSLMQYQVLVSRYPLNWIPASNGDIPPGAFAAGFENGRPLFVCQARYNGGMHIGKVVAQACNIGWGGREISKSHYNVLVG